MTSLTGFLPTLLLLFCTPSLAWTTRSFLVGHRRAQLRPAPLAAEVTTTNKEEVAAASSEELTWSAERGVATAEGAVLSASYRFDCPGEVCGDGVSRSLMTSYIAMGPEEGPPLLLVHGFGASAYHWRGNVATLAAAGNRVYAVDLVGFGASEKPVMPYDSDVWSEQCAAFLRDVAGCGGGKKQALVAGNSIGGFTVLALAATHPDLVRGWVRR